VTLRLLVTGATGYLGWRATTLQGIGRMGGHKLSHNIAQNDP